jgi:hypothetical protein
VTRGYSVVLLSNRGNRMDINKLSGQDSAAFEAHLKG